MSKDYEILGIDENADEKTIKRAYFKLIRTYSPEKDSEQFQKIRAAYERLMEEKERPENSIMLEFPENDKFAKSMFDQIQELMHEQNYDRAVQTAKEGLQYYGDIECFLYMFARCSILNNKSGNAVKAYEKLVKQFPDKLYYKSELAKAYHMRGYERKALAMFRAAYTEGCRDLEFLLEYSMCCVTRDEYNEGISVLKGLVVSIPPEALNNKIPEVLEAYIGLFSIFVYECYPLAEVIDRCNTFLDQVSNRIQDFEDLLQSLCLIVVMISASEEGKEARALAARLKEMVPDDGDLGEFADIMGERIETYKVLEDDRFSPLMKYTVEAYMLLSAPDVKEDTDYVQFMQLDAWLCQLEEWPQQKEELEILRNEYAYIYECGIELWDILWRSNREELSLMKKSLLVEYAKQERIFQNGHYYEFYPERRPNMEQVQWDSLENGTFVRNGKKIGRNEPCPCGSGKKYKNCCGKGV